MPGARLWHGDGRGGLFWEPRMQVARRAGAGVDTGWDKEMAGPFFCRNLPGVR